MTEWISGTTNNITILTENAVLLQAYYMDEANTAQGYTPIAGTWAIDLDRHIIPVTFSAVGRYTFKVIDVNGTIPALFQSVSVVTAYTATDANIVAVNGTGTTDITDFKAVDIDLTPVLNSIAALQLLTLADVEGSMILAKQATLDAIVSTVGALENTDITPVTTAISLLNDVTPAEVRAAFNAAEFKDKTTELELHTWLNSYVNKADWKTPSTEVSDTIWNRLV